MKRGLVKRRKSTKTIEFTNFSINTIQSFEFPRVSKSYGVVGYGVGLLRVIYKNKIKINKNMMLQGEFSRVNVEG